MTIAARSPAALVGAHVLSTRGDRMPLYARFDIRALVERYAGRHHAERSTIDLPHRPAAHAGPPKRMVEVGTVRNVIGVHLYLEDAGGRILLGRRHPDSAYAGGRWHFLAGHCERESAVQCLVREAQEEAGLTIDPADAEYAHTVHLRDSPDDEPRMQVVFRVRNWRGTPQVREPDKCLGWQWWRPQALPEPIVPYAQHAIEQILAGRPYSEVGW
ncbi:NUDIX domain-containing protein [Streptomyces sp. NPDC006283]|uniref:NUDIX hydrolase n=1 Tax=Streptomyces sp. NPDC006283 TaxID=3156741 RepID=UPI0033AA7872